MLFGKRSDALGDTGFHASRRVGVQCSLFDRFVYRLLELREHRGGTGTFCDDGLTDIFDRVFHRRFAARVENAAAKGHPLCFFG